MLTQLNPSQQHAVESDAQSLLIVAGPGTGKTHTLTHRIALAAQHISSQQKILAITFTRKAAQEMQDRLVVRIKNFCDQIFIGTFHQFCVSVLQQYGDTDFSVAADGDILRIAKTIWPGCSSSDYKKRLDKISRYKSIDFQDPVPEIFREFNRTLRSENLYDFDDLLLETLRLVESQENILADIRQTCAHIFVDEYQDVNRVQRDLLKLLAGNHGRITAIGDPNQAIYGFRGSDVRFFNSFADDFKNATVTCLRDNYRNAQDLLAASSQMMAESSDQAVPRQVAAIYDQGLLTIHESATDKAEAEYIVHSVEQLIGGTSMFSQDSGRVAHTQDGEISFGDIAVLYRLKSQARELKKAFERSGMPFHIVGEVNAETDVMDDLVVMRPPEPDIDAEKISLMTLHAAKGLEFPCVFICGCEDGLLPLHIFDMSSDPEEERRLLYVGMTRAKQRLYLTYAKKRMLYGKVFHNPPTLFLGDIEESLKNHSKSQFKKKDVKDDGQMSLF